MKFDEFINFGFNAGVRGFIIVYTFFQSAAPSCKDDHGDRDTKDNTDHLEDAIRGYLSFCRHLFAVRVSIQKIEIERNRDLRS